MLDGPPAEPALAHLVDYGPFAASGEDIVDDVLLTRVDVRIEPEALVADVNAALDAEGALIVAMREGARWVTLSVPRQADQEALDALAARLEVTAVFADAIPGRQAAATLLPPGDAGTAAKRFRITHLLPGRFPAAWNVSSLALRDCQSRRVRIAVPDYYHPNASLAWRSVLAELPPLDFGRASSSYAGSDPEVFAHGYIVLGVLGSLFDNINGTGAMPFGECLSLLPLSVQGLTTFGQWARVSVWLTQANDKLLVSRSLAIPPVECAASACVAEDFDDDFRHLEGMAKGGLIMAEQATPEWDRLLVVNSAGNFARLPSSLIYRGLGLARFGSGEAFFEDISRLATTSSLDVALDLLLNDTTLWSAAPNAGLPDLLLDDERYQSVLATYAEGYLPEPLTEFPLLSVGATSNAPEARHLTEWSDSNRFPHVHAPGESVYAVQRLLDGTSLSAPQVAGLAAYLWLVSPELRAEPSLVTVRAIKANVDDSVEGVRSIDAYASTLSTDRVDQLPTATSAPVRQALLDVNEDGRFDDIDVASFVTALTSPHAETVPSYGRKDLNGDGYVGGDRTSRFDLNRLGSQRFGTTAYDIVQQAIEGINVVFNERALTDLQILCYYAYSPLYAGDASAREALLRRPCTRAATPPQMIDVIFNSVASSGDLIVAGLGGRAATGRVQRMNLATGEREPAETIFAPESGIVLDTLQVYGAPHAAAPPNRHILAVMHTRSGVFANRLDPISREWDGPQQLPGCALSYPQTLIAGKPVARVEEDGTIYAACAHTTLGAPAVIQVARYDTLMRQWIPRAAHGKTEPRLTALTAEVEQLAIGRDGEVFTASRVAESEPEVIDFNYPQFFLAERIPFEESKPVDVARIPLGRGNGSGVRLAANAEGDAVALVHEHVFLRHEPNPYIPHLPYAIYRYESSAFRFNRATASWSSASEQPTYQWTARAALDAEGNTAYVGDAVDGGITRPEVEAQWLPRVGYLREASDTAEVFDFRGPGVPNLGFGHVEDAVDVKMEFDADGRLFVLGATTDLPVPVTYQLHLTRRGVDGGWSSELVARADEQIKVRALHVTHDDRVLMQWHEPGKGEMLQILVP